MKGDNGVSTLRERIAEVAEFVRAKDDVRPKVAILLGTGLGGFADRIETREAIDYDDIPHFLKSTVETHAGQLITGTLNGVNVLALSGRFHYYEGYSMQDVTFPVRVAKELGAETLIVSNACGGLNPQFRSGDLMVISDHINFMGDSPLIGPNDDALGSRFPDMSEPYSADLIELAETVSLSQGIKLQKGVYLGCAGPALETRAEYRMMRQLGADVVGMSTVPEVLVAVHAGLKVLGFSIITDECFPDALKPVNIEKIVATAEKAEPILADLVAECVTEM